MNPTTVMLKYMHHLYFQKVVFLFGDYEFLCKIFGIAGASGKFKITLHTYQTV